MKIELQPATSEHESFLYQVYCTTSEQEMAMVPWSDEQKEAFLRMQFSAQQTDYDKRFADGRQSVIVVDDVKVGRLHTLELEEEIKILDITVLPQHRTKGTATSLLNDLLDQARGSGKRVLVYVEIFNPSLGFFEKRGFQKVMDEGIYYLLEWRAGP